MSAHAAMAAIAAAAGDEVTSPWCEGRALEAWRQQQLLRVLWRQAPEAGLTGWLRDGPVRAARGVSAYRANGQALAARALAAAFPTVAALLGDEALTALAAAHWQQHPPQAGDIARWGTDLPPALAADPQLAELPYLADVARLDALVAACELAPDAPPITPDGLALLAHPDAAEGHLRLLPGTALLPSAWPVASIWHGHQPDAPDGLAPARAALARGDGEAALVWRAGWRARVAALAPGDAAFTAALLAGHTLGQALAAPAAAGWADWAFEPWLLQALSAGWLAAVQLPASPN
jgi:hypothetical protein